MNATICFVDFEASGLHRGSYPIEVGWSSPDLISSGFLISPAPDWGLDDWSRAAELVHGVSFEDCVTYGLSVRDVAVRLNHALDGKVLCSDAPDYDERWLRRLYDAANIQPAFSLKLLPLEPLLRDTLRARGHGDWWPDIEDLSRHVHTRHPRTHRAEADARHMAAMYRSALGLEP
jgi:hypothetical protein